MKQSLAKAIRVCTTAPIPALALCTLAHIFLSDGFASTLHYVMAVLFLTVLPLLGYPAAALLPFLRKKGRNGQRSTEILFSVVGYICGMVFTLATQATEFERVLYATYLLSGLLIALCSFVLHFRASGHACGVAGPIAMLIWYLGPAWAWCALLLPMVYWASSTLKRHTMPQLIAGTLLPVAAMACSMAIL